MGFHLFTAIHVTKNQYKVKHLSAHGGLRNYPLFFCLHTWSFAASTAVSGSGHAGASVACVFEMWQQKPPKQFEQCTIHNFIFQRL